MTTQFSQNQLDEFAKSAKNPKNAKALLMANVGSTFTESDDKPSIVTSRYFQLLADDTIAVTILLESGNYYTVGSIDASQAHSFGDMYDIVVSLEEGQTVYSTYNQKFIYRDDRPVQMRLQSTLPATPPVATPHHNLKASFRYGVLFDQSSFSRANDRVLYELTNGTSKFIVPTGSTNQEFDGQTNTLNSYLRLGDFYVSNSEPKQLRMVYGLDLKNEVVTPRSVPVYLPPQLLATANITPAVLDRLFVRRKKIEQPEKLFQACVNTDFRDEENRLIGKVASRFLNFTDGTITIVVHTSSTQFYYAIAERPEDLRDHCTPFDIIVETVNNEYQYKYLSAKRINEQGEVQIELKPVPKAAEMTGTTNSAALSAFKGCSFADNGIEYIVDSRTWVGLDAGRNKYVIKTTDGQSFEYEGSAIDVNEHLAIGDFYFGSLGTTLGRVYGLAAPSGRIYPLYGAVYLPKPASA